MLALSVSGAIAERVDRAFVHLAFRTRRASERGVSETSLERLLEAARFYPAEDQAGRLFAVPPAARLSEHRVRSLSDGEVVDVDWPSAYQPLHAAYREYVKDHPKNALAGARWLRHHKTSSAILCLHGWGGGTFAWSQLDPMVRDLYRSGVDVLLPALPFHGVRATRRFKRPTFPSTDPMRSNEGCAQAVSDLRSLALAVRQRGARMVGVTGRSLGGFTTALLATVEPTLDAAVPVIPFGSLPELMWEQGEGTPARRRATERGITFEQFAAAFRATTPLARKPLIAADRILFIAGERDRVTPLRHAEKLRLHFGEALGGSVRLETFPGGHLVQAGRGAAMRAMSDFFGRLGFFNR